MKHSRVPLGVVTLLTLFLSACGVQMPSDPHGTLEHVKDGLMRVGVTENAPWVELPASGGEQTPDGVTVFEPGAESGALPSGVEPDLLTGFASELGADIIWTAGSEAELVGALERGELDLIVGGFLSETLWTKKAAVTLPYAETLGVGGPEKHVMLVRLGENRFQVALERYLLEEEAS